MQLRQKLLQLLNQQQYKSLAGVIVYTTFQAQADGTAKYLRSKGLAASSYHAGHNAQACSRLLK